jgi:hypothetical protein
MGGRLWTREEDEILRSSYPELGGALAGTLLPNRADHSVKARALVLGLRKLGGPGSGPRRNLCCKWSAEEDELLLSVYAKMGSDTCSLLPGRTRQACRLRAAKLGVRVVDQDPDGMRTCVDCGETLARSEFYTSRSGATSRVCKPCTGNDKRSAHASDPRKNMLQHAKSRSRRDGVPYFICAKDILIGGEDPVSGRPYRVNSGGPCGDSPSLDKLIPSLGYVPNNVVVVNHRTNRISSDASPQELRAVADWKEREIEARGLRDAATAEWPAIGVMRATAERPAKA